MDKYLSVKKVSGGYEINVDNQIPNEILQHKTSLVCTIIAKLEDLTSYAIILINLPDGSSESLVSFKEVLYTGNYQLKDGKPTLTTDKIDVVTKEEDDKIHVNMSEGKKLKICNGFALLFGSLNCFMVIMKLIFSNS